MKEKGFTLIEILATIVILSFVALISTVLILGVIKNARMKSFEDSAYGIIDAVHNYYVDQLASKLPPEVIYKTWYFPETEDLKFDGDRPIGGAIRLNEDQTVELAFHNGEFCALKSVD